MMNDNWWNATDKGKPKYLETHTKTCPNAYVSTTKAIWNALGLNTELRGEMPATQHCVSRICRPLYSAHYLGHNAQEELSDDKVLLV
jgi:hypothetical protein